MVDDEIKSPTETEAALNPILRLNISCLVPSTTTA